MGTKVIAAEGAGPVHLGALSDENETGGVFFERLFKEGALVVFDGIQWDADMDVLRKALVNKKRAFKEPFIEQEPDKTVRKQLRNLVAHAERLFPLLYPSFKATEVRTSFRPMITGPEPLHFDTYGGPNPLVTAYINVSDVPRVYGIGPSFSMLVEQQPDELRKVARAWDGDPTDLSYPIRQRTMEGLPPLGKDTPRHRVELAPGAIWFFNAKTVSHEVVYGRGAVGVSWEVPDLKGVMQADLLKGLR